MRLVRTQDQYDEIAADLEKAEVINLDDSREDAAPDEGEFWSFVPEHAGEDFLDSGEDEEWLGRIKKRFPFGRESEPTEPKA